MQTSILGTNFWLESALRSAASISGRCLWSGNRATWLLPRQGSSPTVFAPASIDLYDGIAGICYFLALAAAATSDTRIKITALAASRTIIDKLTSELAIPEMSSWTGKVGVAWVLYKIGLLLDDECSHEAAFRALDSIDLNGPHQVDVVAGSAGALLKLRDFPSSPIVSRIALRCCEVIKRAAVNEEGAISWRTVDNSRRHLTGYAHGSSGIAAGLAEGWQITGDAELLSLLEGAFAYDDSCFSQIAGNWPDYREFTSQARGTPSFAVSWCHGAPGIGLARMLCCDLDPSKKQFIGWMIAALDTTLDFTLKNVGPDFSACLCHGSMGNADILLEAGRTMAMPDYVFGAEQIAVAAMRIYGPETRSWPSGHIARQQSPSLMLGEAGLGYFFLRLALSEGSPSILI